MLGFTVETKLVFYYLSAKKQLDSVLLSYINIHIHININKSKVLDSRPKLFNVF